jgi:uncharacterized membrane protein HdeD (DUF308 family)
MNLPIQRALAIVIGISLLILGAVYIRKKKLPNAEQIPGLFFTVLSTIGGIQVIYQGFTGAECQKLLGVEGTLALVIGGGFAVWLGAKEITKLFTS